MINREVNIRCVGVVTHQKSTRISTHSGFINWWDMHSMDEAAGHENGANVGHHLSPSLEIALTKSCAVPWHRAKG